MIQVSFRILHTGSKKPKDLHVLNQMCATAMAFVNKTHKDMQVCYPLWNPEDPVDRVALVHDRQDCKGLPGDRLWVLVGFGGATPPKPPPVFVRINGLDGPPLLHALNAYGVDKLIGNETIQYVPTLPFHTDDPDGSQGWTASTLEDPTHGEVLLDMIPDVVQTVEGVLGDVHAELPEDLAHVGASMAAVTTVVSQLGILKEGGKEWGEACAKEEAGEAVTLGSLVGIASALVLKAQGLDEAAGKRMLRRLGRKEARLDGSRRLPFTKDPMKIEGFTGHRSLWLQ